MYDVISVGSATIDIFVEVDEKEEEFREEKGHRDVCYAIGRKLLVKNVHFSTGGSATNTCVAFSRLGLKAGCIAKLGNDANAKVVLEELKKEKVGFLGSCRGEKTGLSVILVKLLGDRTILAFKGSNDGLSKKDIKMKNLSTKWFYFGTMLGKSFETASAICSFAKKKKIPYAFNPSLYLAKRGIESLKPFLPGASLLVCNREEANALLGSEEEGSALARKLASYSKVAIVTDGPNPAFACEGGRVLMLKPGKTKVVETTGTGDAFAAGALAGLFMKDSLEFALKLGYAEAKSVLSHIGAKERLLKIKEALSEIKRTKVLIKEV